jgi:hypothetical protein
LISIQVRFFKTLGLSLANFELEKLVLLSITPDFLNPSMPLSDLLGLDPEVATDD